MHRNYAVLLFGSNPQRLVPDAVAIYWAYPGRGPVARRLEIAGTLLEQARRMQEQLDSEVVTIFDKRDLKTPNVQQYLRGPRWRPWSTRSPTATTSWSIPPGSHRTPTESSSSKAPLRDPRRSAADATPRARERTLPSADR